MRLIAVILAFVLSSASGNERAIGLLRAWIDAVGHHRAGETDEALSTIGEWTYEDVELMRPFLESLVGALPRGNEERRRRLSRLTAADLAAIRELHVRLGLDVDAFRRRAAILHTDAVLRLKRPLVVTPPPNPMQGPDWARRASTPNGRRVDVMSFDAQYRNLEYSNPHWELAMDMLDALPASPRDPFVAQWYGVIGVYLVEQRRFSDALVHFERARGLVPGDPLVLYGEARLHETLSSPRMQNFVRSTTLDNGVFVRGIDNARTELRRAETLLQRALVADPDLVAARLRLGRVVMQQQRWEEGLKIVERAGAEAQDRMLRYYAHVFAGDAQLALGNLEDAERSYERALTSFPDAQSPRLGLAAALGARGAREEAVAAVLPALTNRPDWDDDPWWVYYDSNVEEEAALLERLRAPFREPLR